MINLNNKIICCNTEEEIRILLTEYKNRKCRWIGGTEINPIKDTKRIFNKSYEPCFNLKNNRIEWGELDNYIYDGETVFLFDSIFKGEKLNERI